MSDVLRVVIVDDEPLALERLSDLLSRLPAMELIGSFESGALATASLAALRPDLVFLDIEMPKVDGFDIVEALARESQTTCEQPPLVCFVTAYPQFASEAFSSGALDFLCKPVRLHRLEQTIERARHAIDAREATSRLQELQAEIEQLRRAAKPEEEQSMWLEHRGEMIRVSFSSLQWVGAEGEYARLHLRDHSILIRRSLTSLTQELADDRFIRIHRSFVVNSDWVHGMRRSRAGTRLVLESGRELAVGRKYRPLVLERLPQSLAAAVGA